jgi:PAS domain S-box-containing protein
MTDSMLPIVTNGIYILIFGLTLVDLVRFRDLPHLEIAILFGLLAAGIVLQAANQLLSVSPPWTGLAVGLLLLSQPYLMMRLLAHFQHVPRVQQSIGVACLVGSWALLLAAGSTPPEWVSVALVLAFAYVEGYATLAFVKGALTTRGVTQLRLLAVAIGSGLLGLIILLAGIASVAPDARDVLFAPMGLLALGSALSYYVGFATPHWLRRLWQRSEVHQFLVGLSGQNRADIVMTALEYLAPAAARATGGTLAVVATGDPDGSTLRVQAATRDPGLDTLALGAASPSLDRAWREQRPVATHEPGLWCAGLRSLGHAAGGASGALVAPLTASGQTYGLLIVLLEHGSLFVEDDLAALSILAEQVALVIERRRLVDRAERERAQLIAVMSSQNDGILLLDAASRIQYCNTRAEDLLDLSAEQLIGASAQTVSARLRPSSADGSAATHALEDALAHAEDRPSFELRLDGSPARDLRIEVFDVADPSGVRQGVGLVLRDVTAERDLARTKDEVVSVVSHELRTPLASVVGFAELLLTRPAMPEAQRQQYLGVMVEEGRRLTALINDFLDMQRLESGRQSIVPRPTPLRPILEQAVNSAGEDVERPIVLDATDELPLVQADADRLRQVLANLLGNARKYSPHGGVIRLEASHVDNQVVIAVQDHGLGLPTSALPRLFEKFYRVDNSDRREIAGTGLGLAISRRIVEGHGGRIWAESAGLGRGARFSLTLPIAPVSVVDENGADVLVVEDGSVFAQLLAVALADDGLSAVCVATAEEALNRMTAAPPRVIVLDLLLPGMQGESFLSHLRKTPAGADIPVVVVTVKDLSPEEHALLKGLGVHSVLRKEPGVAAATARAVEAAIGVVPVSV